MTSRVKQSRITVLYRKVVNEAYAPTLLDAIFKKMEASDARIDAGTFVSAHSGNGHSTNQSSLRDAGVNPASMNEFWFECFETHEKAVSQLQQLGVQTPNDEQIWRMMLQIFDPVYETYPTCVTLRCGNGWQTGSVTQ